MNNNLPRVSVHDLAIQARQKDLVLGTYGRGIWITNIAPLEELNATVLAQDVHLFSISDTVQRVPWQFAANDYLFGQQNLQTPNPPNGMEIWYYLKQAASSAPAIVITDSAGNQVAKLTGSGDAGLHFVLWDTRRPRPGRRRTRRTRVGARRFRQARRWWINSNRLAPTRSRLRLARCGRTPAPALLQRRVGHSPRRRRKSSGSSITSRAQPTRGALDEGRATGSDCQYR